MASDFNFGLDFKDVAREVEQYANKWLSKTAREAKAKANAQMRGSPIQLHIKHYAKNPEAALKAFGKAAVFRAVDREIFVPEGGLRPKTARAFPIIKSSGEVRFRSRIYTNPKYWNRVVKIKGSITKALEDVYDADGANMELLARKIAYIIGIGLVNVIVKNFRKQGFKVEVKYGYAYYKK